MNTNDEDRIFEVLLDYLRRNRGFDFTGYKRSSLRRRVIKQMQLRDFHHFGDYLDYLEVHPEEFTPLFNTILINFTSFFRDEAAWNYLQQQTLPRILNQKLPEEPIRIWSAGCASGEEAYSLAMLLTEILGPNQFRQRVKIYATDVDEESLTQARHARYRAQDIQTVPEEWRAKYFESVADHWVFRPDLRRAVIFGRHDLVQDAPISRLDLLVCRNTLMYFNSETQGRILARFHFALNHTGALFLGRAEMLLTHTNLFTPLNLQHRIFTKVPSVNFRDRLLVLAQGGDQDAGNRLAVHVRLRDAAFNAISVAQIVVDFTGALTMANASARSMFGVSFQDLGRPLQDLEISYRPVELRSRIEQAYTERHTILLSDVVRSLPDGGAQFLDVQITPLQENGSDFLGVSITFADVTRYQDLQAELQRTNQNLETTNEELQSTNEELETTNEELQAINDELRIRTQEANQANAYTQSILSSIKAGVVVIDQQFGILTWNKETEDLWGLRTDEVAGKSFFNLDIGLPVDQLSGMIRACINGEDELALSLNAVNRRGRSFFCRVTCNPLIGPGEERQGVILVMEEGEIGGGDGGDGKVREVGRAGEDARKAEGIE